MAVGKITKRSVEAVEVPAGGRAYLWDDTLKGFGVMVTPSGARSYLVQYRIGGRAAPTRRYTIGQHGNPWTADQARGRAEAALALVRSRIDPVDTEKERLAREKSNEEASIRFAFSTVAQAFIAHTRGRKLRSADDIEAVFRRDLTPFFGNKPLPEIARADIHACLAKLGSRSQSAANKAHSWLRAMFAWAVDQAAFGLTASPMFAMSPPFPATQRQRVLGTDELRHVWNASIALGPPFGAMVQILILTGQRLREVGEMRWDELRLEDALWHVPGSRTKNSHDHLCPLSATAVSILAAFEPDPKRRTGFVFTTNGKTPVAGFSRAKRRLDRLILEGQTRSAPKNEPKPAQIPHWTFHDLRRTLATGLQSLGFPIEVNEAVINHVSGRRGGLARVYQLHDYRAEKANAIQAWAAHIASISGRSGNLSSKEVP